MKPYYQDDAVTIYHGDCREIMPQLPKVDLVVTDPPYGMARHGRYQCGKNSGFHPAGFRSNRFGETVFGDDVPFDPSFLLGFNEVILWGFNHFPQYLRVGTILVWIKRYDDGFRSFLSDAELAWFNHGYGVYCKRDVSLQGESSLRLHPSQKPIGITKWCLGFTKGKTVLDPFMGSGTTLRAAKDLRRQAIGIEVEERYCELAAKRMGQEVLALSG
jgi:hypothetical protein